MVNTNEQLMEELQILFTNIEESIYNLRNANRQFTQRDLDSLHHVASALAELEADLDVFEDQDSIS